MLDLDPYVRTEPLGMFPLFLKRTEMICRLVRLENFAAYWRQANVIRIPKDPQSFSVAYYRTISIISVLSRVFERQVSVRLGRIMERSGVLPTTQFVHQKGMRASDALLCVSHTLESAL